MTLSSTDRVVNLLNALSQVGLEGAGVSELAEEAGLATATAHRMLMDLERSGLAYRTDARHWFANFSFSRQLDATSVSLGAARREAQALSLRLGMASEIVFLRGQSLIWHAKFEPADQSIQLRAHAGFVRSSYELDALSRVALAHRSLDEIENVWDLAGFYGPGVNGERLTWKAARTLLGDVDPTRPQFDMQGNSKGVRRFAIALSSPNQRSVAVLTAVEAAIPVVDAQRHQARILDALTEVRQIVLSEENTAKKKSGTSGGKS